ncbi:hypothetical protein J8273_3182 [Carpediemonas membranifera]|uniref:Uncharacterized protein n=1 Tax=Carpediemonas membranifera TaxID=201153 RepID=A0A8J6E159_9EUKA|nr:hypothetical protein J8273_3182 [Carpediemonas membranifera]|eukprot:KAG9393053.1 hypothetical protein J8273_3182 [Carpediemonas membranifera]
MDIYLDPHREDDMYDEFNSYSSEETPRFMTAADLTMDDYDAAGDDAQEEQDAADDQDFASSITTKNVRFSLPVKSDDMSDLLTLSARIGEVNVIDTPNSHARAPTSVYVTPPPRIVAEHSPMNASDLTRDTSVYATITRGLEDLTRDILTKGSPENGHHGLTSRYVDSMRTPARNSGQRDAFGECLATMATPPPSTKRVTPAQARRPQERQSSLRHSAEAEEVVSRAPESITVQHIQQPEPARESKQAAQHRPAVPRDRGHSDKGVEGRLARLEAAVGRLTDKIDGISAADVDARIGEAESKFSRLAAILVQMDQRLREKESILLDRG